MKKWPLFLGASVLIGAVGSLVVKKKEEEPAEGVADRYFGSWTYRSPSGREEHLITIYPDLSLEIDQHAVLYQLVELSANKMTIRDALGYHVIIEIENGEPRYLYDEADDRRFILTPVLPSTAPNAAAENA